MATPAFHRPLVSVGRAAGGACIYLHWLSLLPPSPHRCRPHSAHHLFLYSTNLRLQNSPSTAWPAHWASWGALGESLGPLLDLLGSLGGLLESSWGVLGASWGPLGGSLGPLGGFLGALGCLLGALRGAFGTSWVVFGASLALFGKLWRHFVGLGSLLGGIWMPNRAQKGSQSKPN